MGTGWPLASVPLCVALLAGPVAQAQMPPPPVATPPPAAAPAPPPANAEPPPLPEPGRATVEKDETTGNWMEIYGFVMTDMGHDFGRMDPDWADVMRPTKLPAAANEFGVDGQTFAGVRQTRFGVKTGLATPLGEMKTIFEWELFGTGIDAGQTTLRLRHAYGELGPLGAGQYWSPFMDIDVFPNSIEYWGPNGMVFFRNVQVRWMPIKGDTRLTFALERPGASGDAGAFQERIELQDIIGRYPVPDLSGEFRLAGSPGYVKLSGIVRYITWDDLGTDALNLSGDEIGWGANLSGNLKLWQKNVLKLQAVYGRGIENYMNDGGVDIGARNNPGNATTPVVGKALPILGIVAFVDFYWGERWSTAVGYSLVNVWNEDAQSPDAFHRGHYALGNLLFKPTSESMVGAELQWGQRVNAFDGWSYDAFKVQFSFRYNFSLKLGGAK